MLQSIDQTIIRAVRQGIKIIVRSGHYFINMLSTIKNTIDTAWQTIKRGIVRTLIFLKYLLIVACCGYLVAGSIAWLLGYEAKAKYLLTGAGSIILFFVVFGLLSVMGKRPYYDD